MPLPSTPTDLARSEAILAGTLCLMSCYVAHPIALYAERVKDNLARLSDVTELSPELRLVCKRLSERWDAIVDDAQQRGRRAEAIPDARPLH